MITKAKVEIFISHRGNIDGWAREIRDNSHSTMKDEDWYMIDSFLQDLKIIMNALASNSFAKKITDHIRKQCDTEETLEMIKKYGGIS